MRKHLGWVALAIPVIGGTLSSYMTYTAARIAAEGGRSDAGAADFQQILALVFAAGGCVVFAFTRFRSNLVKWIFCFPLYVLFTIVVLLAIEIAINGLHLRLF